jgi:multidrug efflux pump subunit AcrA (membrane-fusion protein)
MTRPRPTLRAAKPNQRERAQRELVIDNLIGRALRGHLTIPEAALLADYVRADRRNAQQTRQSLADTTRALERHREAARTAIREAEQRAEQAEQEADATASAAGLAVSLVRERAERAETAIARVRALHRNWEADPGHCAHCQDGMGTPLPWPCPTLAALGQPAPAAATQTTDQQEQP